MHTTRFLAGDESFTFYNLPKGINARKPLRVLASAPFDKEDKQVAALQFQMMSTYYGEQFLSVDVAADGYDGREYRTRIVVAQVDGRWYAMPRCRSAKSFYVVADAMQLVPPDA